MEFHRGTRGFGIFRYGATPLRPSKSLHNWWFWLASAKPNAENTRSEGENMKWFFTVSAPPAQLLGTPTRCCMPQHRNPLLIFRTHFALFAFRPAHETFARPSDRCHDAYEYCNLLKNSRPSWPSFTPYTPQNVKSWGRTDEENTQYLPRSWFWFFFFFFNNDLKNQFWCISLNEGLRVFWQIINFHISGENSGYFGKIIIFRKIIYFRKIPPPSNCVRTWILAAWQNGVPKWPVSVTGGNWFLQNREVYELP